MQQRCTAHPGRVAAGDCPRCARPCCAADLTAASLLQNAGGCPVCRGRAVDAGDGEGPVRAVVVMRLTRRAVLAGHVRAALAAMTMCLLGSLVGLEYVGAQTFSIVVPGLVGLLCASVGARAAAPVSTPWLRVIAMVYAVLSALYDFRFTDLPYGPTGRWLPPVLTAGVVAVVFPLPARVAAARRPR